MIRDQSIQKLNQKKIKLIEDIRITFDGVTLGDGIGPYETLAIEDWVDENSDEYQMAKKKDQKDWQRLASNMSDISSAYMYMSYFGDTKGQVFALPAYMTSILLLEDRMKYSSLDISKEVLSSLDQNQLQAVDSFKKLLRSANKHYFRKETLKSICFGLLTNYQKTLLLVGGAAIIIYLLFGIK